MRMAPVARANATWLSIAIIYKMTIIITKSDIFSKLSNQGTTNFCIYVHAQLLLLFTYAILYYLIIICIQYFGMRKNSRNQPYLRSLASIILLSCLIFWSQQNPIAFTVVNTVQPSATFDEFLTAISRPAFDAVSNMQTGYNMVSLAGFNEKSTYASMNNDLSPLYLWRNVYETILGNKANPIGGSSRTIQQHIVDKVFHKNGSRILMHVNLRFPVTSSPAVSSTALGQEIVTTSTELQLDGISIAFSDHNAVKDNTASDWLESLLSYIKANTQGTDMITVLIIPPTFVGKMKLFKSFSVNSIVDYFVLQYYNTLKVDYNTQQSLFESSLSYPQTSLFEIARKQGICMDICRTLIAKPAEQTGTWNYQQFMTSSDLNYAFLQANTKQGWFAGYANLHFESDKNGAFVNQVLSGLRDQCTRNDNCYC